MVIVGIDAHTQSNTAAAVDEQGRELATATVGAHPVELDRLCAWIRELGSMRLVAIEVRRASACPSPGGSWPRASTSRTCPRT